MNKVTIILAVIALFGGLFGGMLIRSAFRDEPTQSKSASPPAMKQGHQMPEKMDAQSRPSDSRPSPASQATLGAIKDIANPKCPIMGSEIAEGSVSLIYNGLLVHFCCGGCDTKFLDRPLELLNAMKTDGAKIPQSALKKSAHPKVIEAGNTVCPVLDEVIGDSTIYAVQRGVKVGLCCDNCKEEFASDPDMYLRKAAKTGQIPEERLSEDGK